MSLSLLPLLLLTVACDPGAKELDREDTSPPGTEPDDFEIEVHPAENMPTVLIMDWDVELEGLIAARIELGPDLGFERDVLLDVSSKGPYQAKIIGLKSDTEYHLRVVVETLEGETFSQEVLASTGPLPAALPNLSVGAALEHWEGFLVNGLVGSMRGPLILDSDGDYVWWKSASVGGEAEEGGGRGMLGRVRLSLDGGTLYYIFCNILGLEDTAIYRVALDGTELDPIPTTYGHHDIVELPDGNFAYLAYDPRDVNGQRILGDRIVEVDRDGVTREAFNLWDHPEYPPEPQPGPGLSWPHANALDYLPEEDAYLMGLLLTGTILKIDRSSGEILWSMGGGNTDFRLDGSRELFDSQHQFELLEESILVFINGGMGPGAASGVREYGFEEGVTEIREVWSYFPKPSINCMNLGDVDRLDSGNTLVTFSATGRIQEVTAEGELVWDLSADVGGAFGYSTRLDTLDGVGAP